MAFSYDAAIGYLYSLQNTGIKLGLDNIRMLLKALGNPEGSFRAAHIAGTNGKGSTSALLASMLGASGEQTGLFISPHILSFTERISIDNVRITELEAAALAWQVKEKADAIAELDKDFCPTFFEIVTAMGFVHFMRSRAEWAVIETGLGGRLDSTNAISPEVTVITPVGLDHKDFLGSTLKEVAYEKAGIIKEKTPLVLASQEPEAMSVLLSAARDKDAPVYIEGRDFSYTLRQADAHGVSLDYASEGIRIDDLRVNLRGAYQAQNTAVAIRALEAALASKGKEEIEKAAREGAENIRWHGRLERVAQDVYIDGAHNPPAARTLAEELKARPLAPPEGLVLVMGIMKDKDAEGIIRPLLPLAAEVIFTAPAYGRASRPEDLARIAEGLGQKARCFDKVSDAMKAARDTGKTVLVTGSFYTMGEALESLGQKGVLTTLQESRPDR